MADEDDEQNQDETPEPEARIFTLTEAERARQELEPFLEEAMDCRKKLAGLETDLTAVSARITMMGGVIVPYDKLATLRVEHQQVIVPFSQVLRIDSRQQYRESQPVILNTLLGFPRPAASPEAVRPVLILQINPYFSRPLAVQVDEVLGAVRAQDLNPETEALIETFRRLSRQSYASGLGALYAYESQFPGVASAKIDGLVDRYGIRDEATLRFFRVHESADVEHSAVCRALLDRLPDSRRGQELPIPE